MPDRTVPLRAYDTRANTFSLQQIGLVLDAPPDVGSQRRYGGRLDLQFGQATETVQGSPANEPRPDVYRHVWQAYGSYVFPLGPNGLQADAGKFASNLGYETNYAKDNQAFSRAYLFNFLPFYHAGLRLTFPVHERLTAMYALTNGIQQTEEFNDFKSQQVALIVKPVTCCHLDRQLLRRTRTARWRRAWWPGRALHRVRYLRDVHGHIRAHRRHRHQSHLQ